MKIKALISVVLAITFLLTGNVFAAVPEQTAQTAQASQTAQAPKPVEVPDIKIIMDGAFTKFEKVPLSVSNSTLLPLRELLVKLGVPNDDEHIIYNGTEKSVTVWDGQTKIYLLIGQKEAFVDDQPITLNAAPILYQNSTYIPLRFVAEALNRKVIWEGSMKAAFICDEAKYESIKLLLDKSNEESGKMKKYKQEIGATATIESEEGNVAVTVESQAAVDRTQKKMSQNMLMSFIGVEVSAQTYYTDNTSYTQDALTGGWKKQTYDPAEYNKLFESQDSANILSNTEVLCAGLNQVSDENDDEILLEGDAFLVDMFRQMMESQNFGLGQATKGKIDYNDFSLGITLDKDTGLLKKIIMDVNMLQRAEGTDAADIKTAVQAEFRFSDYDGDFVISVPSEAVKNAVPAQ